MSELKPLPCPICGDELKIHGPEDWHPTPYDPDSGGDPYNAVCDCGFRYSNGSYDYAEFIACLNRRAPVVHGRWILLGKNEHDYETSVEEKCSLCGRYVYRYDTELQDNYCPNCGARMDVKEDKQA